MSAKSIIKDSIISKMYRSARNVLDYKPQVYPDPFVLEEWETKKNNESSSQNPEKLADNRLKNCLKAAQDALGHAKELAGILEDTVQQLKKDGLSGDEARNLIKEISKLAKKQTELTLPLYSFDAGLKPDDRKTSASLSENEEILRQIYNSPQNSDVIFQHFEVTGQKQLKAMLVFLDGMVDKKMINLSVLKPLMLQDGQNLDSQNTLNSSNKPQTDIIDIINLRLPVHITKKETGFDKISQAVSSGETVLFIDGGSQALLIDTRGYEHRQVDSAQNERSVQGALSAFTEVIQTNTGMVRAIMPTSDLINETLTVGDKIPVACSIMYLKSVANPQLVNEIKRRLNGVRTDYVIDIGVLEQFIIDQPNIFFPKSLQTERPDRVAVNLSEGMVAIFLQGSSFAMIVPVTFFSFFHFIEDYSLQTITANIMRMTRVIGAILTALVPGLYIALTYFHQEAIPTDLALALAASREKVPFPAIVEILIMEIAFELVRESGLRMPGVLGPTIGIVGTIIIGQAAVTAQLVSPIVVVIVAITGLASFAIPDYRMSGVFRDLRFFSLMLGFFLGLVGIGAGVLLFTLALCYTKSFGVPYLSPLAPKTNYGFDAILRGPVFRQELRPDFVNAKEYRRQPHISREWAVKKSNEQE